MGGGRARLGGRGQLSPLQQEALPSTRKRQCSAESPQPSQGSSTPAALAGPWLCDTPGRGSQQPAKAPLRGTESHARKGGHSHWRDIHSDARAWSTRWRPPSTLPLATATAPPAVGGPKPNNPPAEEPALRQQQVPVPHCSSPQVCAPLLGKWQPRPHSQAHKHAYTQVPKPAGPPSSKSPQSPLFVSQTGTAPGPV